MHMLHVPLLLHILYWIKIWIAAYLTVQLRYLSYKDLDDASAANYNFLKEIMLSTLRLDLILKVSQNVPISLINLQYYISP